VNTENPVSSFFRPLLDVISGNFVSKVFSLVAAILLWFALVEGPELTATIAVPVHFRNFPAGLDLAGDEIVDQVQLQVRGPRDALALSKFANTAVVFDVSGFSQPGSRTFTVPDAISGLPPQASVIRAMPYQMRLSFERHVTAKVPIQVSVTALPPILRVARIEVNPPEATIAGPESQVRRITSVQTDSFDFGTIGKDFNGNTIEARLHTYIENRRVTVSVSTADVKVHVEKLSD
jgi:hypothetical protein